MLCQILELRDKFLFVILSEAKDLKQNKVQIVQNEILRLTAQNDNVSVGGDDSVKPRLFTKCSG